MVNVPKVLSRAVESSESLLGKKVNRFCNWGISDLSAIRADDFRSGNGFRTQARGIIAYRSPASLTDLQA
jgi:hypothetical protein